tara:strand:+ start:2684 stop:2953 length:270 start_codon:yes stop_codon:yes gene_type:complete
MNKKDKIEFEKDIKQMLILEKKFKKFKKTEEYKLVNDYIKTRNKIRAKVKTHMEDNKIFSKSFNDIKLLLHPTFVESYSYNKLEIEGKI